MFDPGDHTHNAWDEGTRALPELTDHSAATAAALARRLKRLGLTGDEDDWTDRYLVCEHIVEPSTARSRQQFEAIARFIRDLIAHRWVKTRQAREQANPKRIYYLSMELLIGRTLNNNIINLAADPLVRRAVRREGWSVGEMSAQIERLRFTRELTTEPNGHMHFRMSALLWNGSAIGERMRTSVYSEPALFPATPWLGGPPPAPPTVTSVITEAIEVAAGDATPIAWWMVQSLGTDGRWRMTLLPGTLRRIALNALGDLGGRRIAVTAVDRVGQASPVTLFALQSQPASPPSDKLTRRPSALPVPK